MLNDTMIKDFHEEREAERKAARRAEMLAKRKAKAAAAELEEEDEPARPEKEKKVKTSVLQANDASDDDAIPPQMDDSGSGNSDDGIVEDASDGEDVEGKFQFSKFGVPTKVDTNTQFKKGKNKYQKLREAIYREKLEAERPVESTWENIKQAAAGGKVEATAAQIRRGIKNEKRQKKKNFEKKVEKAEKQKKKEEWEAKKAKSRKGKSFGKH